MCTLLLVAIETYFRLRRRYQYRVLSRMARVAIRASNIVAVMLVAVPAEARIGRVAIQTKAVLSINGCRGFRTENGVGSGPFLAAPYACGVLSRWSVTSFALQLAVTERSAWVSRVRMWSLENREDGFFLVT